MLKNFYDFQICFLTEAHNFWHYNRLSSVFMVWIKGRSADTCLMIFIHLYTMILMHLLMTIFFPCLTGRFLYVVLSARQWTPSDCNTLQTLQLCHFFRFLMLNRIIQPAWAAIPSLSQHLKSFLKRWSCFKHSECWTKNVWVN